MGNLEHGQVKSKVTSLVALDASSFTVPNRNVTGKPDVVVEDTDFLNGSDFSEVWIEVETTTVAKPAYIVQRVYEAAINDAKCGQDDGQDL